MPSQSLSPVDTELIKSIEVNGFVFEVGVLQDGTPFMSGRGLARACGISNSTLVGWGEEAPKLGDKNRAGKMASLLATYGYGGDRFFYRLPSNSFGGKGNVSAYPYSVCMAFLDYYCFEGKKAAAKTSLRVLSEKQLPQFIYAALGEQPTPDAKLASPPQRDRPPERKVPTRYFSIPQVTPGAKLRSIQQGLNLNAYAISYASVAKAWSRYWNINKLAECYGDRMAQETDENQNWSPSQTYLYPSEALPEFKHWLNLKYVPERYPSYLQRKIKQRLQPAPYIRRLPQAS